MSYVHVCWTIVTEVYCVCDNCSFMYGTILIACGMIVTSVGQLCFGHLQLECAHFCKFTKVVQIFY
jgi:hypothetical protein